MANNVQAGPGVAVERQQFLLFSCGSYARVAVPLALVDRLEKFPAALLERMADSWVVQYRGELLRVAGLANVLGCGGDECLEAKDVHVVVIRRNDRAIGLAVDRIIDVQQGEVSAPCPAAATGLLATFVLNGMATELLDLPKVLEAADPIGPRQPWAARAEGCPVLIGTRSQFLTTSLRQYLQLGGYPVIARDPGAELAASLDKGPFQAVLIEWPSPPDSQGWMDTLRSHSESAGTPVICIGKQGQEAPPAWMGPLCAPDDCQSLLGMLAFATQGQPVASQSGVSQ